MNRRAEMPGWAMITVVTVISVLAAGMVVGVHSATRTRIEDNLQHDKMRAKERVLGLSRPPAAQPQLVDLGPDRGNRTASVYRTRDAGGEVLGTAVETASNSGYSGMIRVMVGLGPDGSIRGVEILEQSETPGLGANIRNPEFLLQFSGKSLRDFDFRVRKDGGGIDGITGATISSRAVCEAVADALAAVEVSER